MRILMLADISSAHAQKWVVSLATHGIEIGIFSLNNANSPWYEGLKGVTILKNGNSNVDSFSLFQKLGYLNQIKELKGIIKSFQPDVIHAHYATSYGLLGVLSGYRPLVISAWGTDVFSFPKKSFLHSKLLSYIFSNATKICSTSECMKQEIIKYTNQDVEVIPFGVDVKRFSPVESKEENKSIVIGNIKALEPIYGDKILVDAFILITKKYPSLPLQLLLVGDGSQRQELEELAQRNGITKQVTFTGRIPHAEIEKVHQQIDIFVSLTLVDESFGVSLVESMACAKAIIASDTPGFKEVLGSEENGIIVKKKFS
ncbi:MAG: glycosyltransferase [Bacteroidetes bacterium]|nr:glycosyltransferase [Bacteroidota bacterium]